MAKSSKGGEFERTIRKFLTMWLTGQQEELYFWRCPGSGSFFTKKKRNVDLSNDIVSIKPEADFFSAVFSVECKKGYPKNSFDLHLKKNKNNGIRDFWQQTVDGAKGKKEPMLIYGKKGMPTWIGITTDMAEKLKLFETEIISISMTWGNDFKHLPPMICYDLEDFFALVTPDKIKALSSTPIPA